MSPVTFSLTAGSLGDLIAVAQLLVDIGTVIYGSVSEGPQDHRDLMREIDIAHSFIFHLQSRLKDDLGPELDTYRAEVTRLHDEIDKCLVQSLQAMAVFKKTYPDLEAMKKSSNFQKVWEVTKWGWNRTTAAATLRQALYTQRNHMDYCDRK